MRIWFSVNRPRAPARRESGNILKAKFKNITIFSYKIDVFREYFGSELRWLGDRNPVRDCRFYRRAAVDVYVV